MRRSRSAWPCCTLVLRTLRYSVRRCRTSDRYTRPTPAERICALVCGLTVSTKVGNETPKRHGVAQTRYPLKGMASRRNDKACVHCAVWRFTQNTKRQSFYLP
ncbi:hypothetical protein BJX62DRAFT_139465 [Aspergillus germanicus]